MLITKRTFHKEERYCKMEYSLQNREKYFVTTDNEYIPFYTFLEKNFRSSENYYSTSGSANFNRYRPATKVYKDYIKYRKVGIPKDGYLNVDSNFEHGILKRVFSTTGCGYYKFKVAGEPYFVVAQPFSIVEEDTEEILLIFAVNRNNLSKILADKGTIASLDTEWVPTEDIVLIINRKLYNDPKYKNFIKKIDSEIIQPCLDINIDVLTTSGTQIESKLFNTVEKTFNSIEEIDNHLLSIDIESLYLFNEIDYLLEEML